MTGEVTLAGRVLPIGGVKQKLLAAHRAGLTEVIIPARNEPDLDDLPEEVREQLTIHVLADVADVLALALRPAAEDADTSARGAGRRVTHHTEEPRPRSHGRGSSLGDQPRGPSRSSAARIWLSHSVPSWRPFGSWSPRSQRHVVIIASTRIRHSRSKS